MVAENTPPYPVLLLGGWVVPAEMTKYVSREMKYYLVPILRPTTLAFNIIKILFAVTCWDGNH